MKCFVCFKQVENFKLLSYHLRAQHYILALDKVTCNQNGCLRSFHNLCGIFKHIKSNHCTREVQSCNSYPPYEDVCPDNDLELMKDDTFSDDRSDIHYNSNQYELAYILKLYGKLNVTRKDIESIISDTKVLTQSVTPGSSSFKDLDSEHLIKSRLIVEGLYIEPEQYLV